MGCGSGGGGGGGGGKSAVDASSPDAHGDNRADAHGDNRGVGFNQVEVQKVAHAVDYFSAHIRGESAFGISVEESLCSSMGSHLTFVLM